MTVTIETTATFDLGDCVVTLTQDHVRTNYFVEFPLEGLLPMETLELDRQLAALGLETMPHDECAWDFVGDVVRVYCAETV